jgi:hypothetical protein
MASRELDPVRVVSTSNITLSGLQTLEGVSLAAGDAVLVAGQTDTTTNGVYLVVDGGAWTRRADFDTGAEMLPGSWLTVLEGATPGLAGSTWYFSNATVPTLGVTLLVWRLRAYGTAETAGEGLDQEGSTLELEDHYLGAAQTVTGRGAELTLTPGGVVASYVERGITATFLEGLEIDCPNGLLSEMRPGACYIENPGLIAENANPLGVNIIESPAAGAMQYVYAVWNSVSGLIFEAFNTVPETFTDFTPTARTADATRRYVGAFRWKNGSTADHYSQVAHGNGREVFVRYIADINAAPFLAVNAGTATTEQTVDIGPNSLKLVPPTCREVFLSVSTNAASGVALGHPEDGIALSSTVYLVRLLGSTQVEVRMPLSSAQQFTWMNVAGSGSTSIRVLGYWDRR